MLPQLEFGPQLLAGRELPRLDLRAQVLGDLPVHGDPHRPSSLPDRLWFGIVAVPMLILGARHSVQIQDCVEPVARADFHGAIEKPKTFRL